MRLVSVVSKKFDVTPRDEYETYLYEKGDEAITLFSPPGPKSSDLQKIARFKAEDGLIEIYFLHK